MINFDELFEQSLNRQQGIEELLQTLDFTQYIKYSREELEQLVLSASIIRQTQDIQPLDHTLLQQLIERTKQSIVCSVYDNQEVDMYAEPYTGACGCLGARDGELFCNCIMVKLRYNYRFDIALSILNGYPS